MLLQELEDSLSLEYANCAASEPTLARAQFCQSAWTQTVTESELPEDAKERLNALAARRASEAMTLAALEACFPQAIEPEAQAACSQRWLRSVEASRMEAQAKADLLAGFERRARSAALERQLDDCHGLDDSGMAQCVSAWLGSLSAGGLTPQEGKAATERALARLKAEEDALANASSPKSAPEGSADPRLEAEPDPAPQRPRLGPASDPRSRAVSI